MQGVCSSFSPFPKIVLNPCPFLSVAAFTERDYIVLSGQHITEALRRRQADYRDNLLDVLDEYLYVLATVLDPGTDVATRELAAGDALESEMGVRVVTIPQFASLILSCQGAGDKRERLALAWRKSG